MNIEPSACKKDNQILLRGGSIEISRSSQNIEPMKMYSKYSGKNVALLFLLSTAVVGCTSQGKPAPTPERNEEKVPTVETIKVKREVTSYTLSLPGEIAPFEEVNIYPKVSGFVQQMFVDRGSYVSEGQLLARLEAPEITQRYAAAAAKQREVRERLYYSQQSYARFLKASKSEGAVAAIEVEQAKARLMSDSASFQSLKAEMHAAKQLAAYLEIRAPFAGIISDRMVSPGALVGANDRPLFRLAQQDRLRLILAIPEKHAQALPDSATVQYTVSSYPNDTFSARVSRSSGVLDNELRALMIEVDIENRDGKLNGGEYVHAEVIFRRRTPSLWVPATSIVDAPSGVYVLRMENDTIRHVAVTRGISKDGLTEVFGSLKPTDIIVVEGSEALRDGMKVSSR